MSRSPRHRRIAPVAGLLLLSCLFLAAVAPVAPARAADAGVAFSARQQALLKTVMDARKGYISADLYADFWKDLPPGTDPQTARQLLRATISDAVIALQLFSREAWRSAQASYAAGKRVETPDYTSLRDRLRAYCQQAPAQHAPMLQGPVLEARIADHERLLAAAAGHMPYAPASSAGSQAGSDAASAGVTLSPELISTAISQLDGSIDRLNLLVKPRWDPVDQDLALPEAGLRLRFPWHFARMARSLPGPTGKPFLIVIYTAMLDEGTEASISFIQMDMLKTTDAAAIQNREMRIAEHVMAEFGADANARIQAVDWRGLPSAIATGTGSIKGKPAALYGRILMSPAHDGMINVTISAPGTIDALRALAADFEKRIAVGQP